MCELFGMSSQRPLDLSKMLAHFGQRGGATADNPDGWGLAYWENANWQLLKSTGSGGQQRAIFQYYFGDP
jgi:predicted glutamine amidotransferase